jgi:Dyp-type peroxidase family
MAINLSIPLAWTKAGADELNMLQCLQGNILKGHGRHFTANLFFRLDPAKTLRSRRMLRDLANFHISSAYRQLLDAQRFKETRQGAGPFVHLALAAKGYQALGLASSAPTDPDFRAGMKAPASLVALHDPAVSDWEPPFQQDIHGVVLAAEETASLLGALALSLRELVEDGGGTVAFVQHGASLFNAAGEGIEHFGYVDGRSQPLLLQEDIDAETAEAGSSRWNPAFPLATALVKDPGTTDAVSFGSYFVFRKLEQAVRAFKTREQAIADRLGLAGPERERAGAMIVGRFEDGTPVTLSRTARSAAPPNNFNYTNDPGTRCPLHGHIRKTNPRGSGGAEPEMAERAHLMVRRGIPFEDVKRAVLPSELPDAGTMAAFLEKVAPLLPERGVGLLFMAYNHSIGEQFRFTQQIWANNTNFPTKPVGAHGLDPVIGQGANRPGEQKLPKAWDDATAGTLDTEPFGGFVAMKGGEYFFSPSLTFLLNL